MHSWHLWREGRGRFGKTVLGHTQGEHGLRENAAADPPRQKLWVNALPAVSLSKGEPSRGLVMASRNPGPSPQECQRLEVGQKRKEKREDVLKRMSSNKDDEVSQQRGCNCHKQSEPWSHTSQAWRGRGGEQGSRRLWMRGREHRRKRWKPGVKNACGL